MNEISIYENAFLREHIEKIEVLSDSYPDFFYVLCNKANIPINKDNRIKTVIAWNEVNPKYEFFYDYIGSEKDITNLMKNSNLKESKNIIIEFGYNLPIISTDIMTFVKNWDDFVAASGYSGITCLSGDGKYIMEFSDDSNYFLRSNFLIKSID